MSECAKTRQHSNLEFQNFPREDPRTPSSRGGEGRGGKGKEGGEEREGKGKGRREGKDRERRGGTGRDRGGKEGRNGGFGGDGRGARHGLPLETCSGSAPENSEEFVFMGQPQPHPQGCGVAAPPPPIFVVPFVITCTLRAR